VLDMSIRPKQFRHKIEETKKFFFKDIFFGG